MSENNEYRNFVLASRVRPGCKAPVEGTQERPCCECGHMLWVSPSTFKKLSDTTEKFDFICDSCMQVREKLIKENGGSLTFECGDDAQIKELQDLGLDATCLDFIKYLVTALVRLQV